MAISPSEFIYIRNLMVSRTGIVIPDNQKYLIEARLLPVARRTQIGSVNDVIKKLQGEEANGLATTVVDALLPKETAFFRDNHPFQLLRKQILPILEGSRYGIRKLTIWCAGCSTGQEAYSVGMLLHTYFPQLMQWDVKILATDLSEEALVKANEGRYNEIEVSRGVPPIMAKQCFRQEAGSYFVRDEIRRIVHFEQLNLIEEWPGVFDVDVVMIRNVLSHFSPQAKQKLLSRISEVLRPDGYVLLGAQETTVDVDSSYRMVPTESAVYFQLGHRR